MSGSKTIIVDDNRLDNVHPGDILRDDFMIGTDIPLNEVAIGAGIDPSILGDILGGQHPIDAAIDARLTRYLGTSYGFFLRLQNNYDLEEVIRHDDGALDRIVPRAA